MHVQSLASRYWNIHCLDIFEPNLTKASLVNKLKSKFSGPDLAVIGTVI